MEIRVLSPFPKNSNPFNHDLFRMGQDVDDTGFMIMWGSDKNSIIVVDTESGERIEVSRAGSQDTEQAKVAENTRKMVEMAYNGTNVDERRFS